MDRYLQAAWHGSPHKFDKFSTEAIGTGEGAQVYGFGLYFAESKAVAEHYRKALANRADVTVAGRDIVDESGRIDTAGLDQALETAGVAEDMRVDSSSAIQRGISTTPSDVIASAREYLAQQVTATEQELPSTNPLVVQLKERATAFDKLAEDGNITAIERKGQTYRVELAPQEDEYLLWDKPFDQQSEKVKAALSEAWDEQTALYKERGDQMLPHVAPWSNREDSTGENIYRSVTGSAPFGREEEGSKKLLGMGIRGIKYLDQMSRGGGEGSYNYVIFDDRDVNIEEVLLQRGPLDGPQSKGMTEAQRQIYSDVIGTRRSPMQKLRKWWEDGKGQRATAMRQGFIDAQAPTDRQERELNDGDLKSAELSATKAAHSVAHTDRRVVHLLKNGMLKLETDADGKVEWFNIDETWTEGGLEDIFKDIARDGQIEAWQLWAYANRAQRLIKEGKEKNMSQAQIDEALKLGEAHLSSRWRWINTSASMTRCSIWLRPPVL